MFLQVVSESGLFTPDDVASVQNAGVFAVSFLSHSFFIRTYIIQFQNTLFIFRHRDDFKYFVQVYIRNKNQKHMVYFKSGLVCIDIPNWLSFVFSGFGRRIPSHAGRSWPSNCWAVREGALTLIYSRSALANCCI